MSYNSEKKESAQNFNKMHIPTNFGVSEFQSEKSITIEKNKPEINFDDWSKLDFNKMSKLKEDRPKVSNLNHFSKKS